MNQGCYWLLLDWPEAADVSVGALGLRHFAAGAYVYAGSARRNLQARLDRHCRKVKKCHWHIDYLTSRSPRVVGLPILTDQDLECELADALDRLGGIPVAGFGCSDCKCHSHLFGFSSNPLDDESFQRELRRFRQGLEPRTAVR